MQYMLTINSTDWTNLIGFIYIGFSFNERLYYIKMSFGTSYQQWACTILMDETHSTSVYISVQDIWSTIIDFYFHCCTIIVDECLHHMLHLHQLLLLTSSALHHGGHCDLLHAEVMHWPSQKLRKYFSVYEYVCNYNFKYNKCTCTWCYLCTQFQTKSQVVQVRLNVFFHIPINAKVSILLADYPCFCFANRLHQLCFVSKLSNEMIK